MVTNQEKIDNIFKQFIKNKHIHEAVLLAENTHGDFSYSHGHGGKDLDTPILMASITKLLTTACIFILIEQGKLSLHDAAATFFPKDTLDTLHLYKGKDYSLELTIAHLLFQTSGLPDVFEEGSKNAKQRAIDEDMQFDFDHILKMTKGLKPHFPPSKRKRAHYSDINFDLLGKIIETVTDSTLEEVYKQFIFEPLGLEHTYLPETADDFVPTIYFKDRALYRPKFVKSCRASGGGITTARELMRFIKAFFGGKLFDETIFRKLEANNRLQAAMFPIHYGAGYMRVPLSGLATLFMGKGELMGHSGSSGSFAFYFPLKDLFFVGDVNQMANPALPVRLAMRLAISMKA